MIVDAISDIHGHYPQLEGGDLLIVAGDLTDPDEYDELDYFIRWLDTQPYNKKIVISGNHDTGIERNPTWLVGHNFEYLCDSGTEFEYEDFNDPDYSSQPGSVALDGPLFFKRKKLKIWGSPWTLRFEGMNPDCMAFTCETEEELAEKFALIPDDVDILVTHSPPYAVGDKCTSGVYPEWVGSKSLALEHKNRLKVKLHVFGHIHEAYGREVLMRNCDQSEIILVNASHVNERYEPVNKPIRIKL